MNELLILYAIVGYLVISVVAGIFVSKTSDQSFRVLLGWPVILFVVVVATLMVRGIVKDVQEATETEDDTE